MLEAEAAAAAAKRGLHHPHGGVAAARAAPIDLTDARRDHVRSREITRNQTRFHEIDLTDARARERARQFVSTLQRHGKSRAIVQYVVNGSRLKLFLPKDNLLLSFGCVGI